MRDRPIFICGHPKAGTSLLRAAFDSHPQLIVYPEETVFFRRFLPRARGLNRDGLLALADETLIHIFTWNREDPSPSQAGFPDRDYSAIPYEQVRTELRRLVDERWRHLGDMLSAAVLAYGRVCGQVGPATRAWVEKSPYNEYYTDYIYRWWPQARCVHILRDPRDNYVSYQRKHAAWSAEFFAANWRRSTLAGIANRQRFGEHRYRIVRYEDLAQSPEDTLRGLTEFLGIDWDPGLVSPTRAGTQWQGNSMFAEQFKSISAAPVARWKEKLSPQDAKIIEWMAGRLFRNFGYPPSHAGLRDNLSAAWRAAAWPIRRRLAGYKEKNNRSQED